MDLYAKYDKINSYVKNICHASSFSCSFEVMKKLNELDKYKYPICVAKTQYSLSDNKNNLGNPVGHKMTLTDVKVYNGAKVIVCYFGNIFSRAISAIIFSENCLRQQSFTAMNTPVRVRQNSLRI